MNPIIVVLLFGNSLLGLELESLIVTTPIGKKVPKKPKRLEQRGRKSKARLAAIKAKKKKPAPRVYGVKSEMDQFRERQRKAKK
jgi:hypothetical protein